MPIHEIPNNEMQMLRNLTANKKKNKTKHDGRDSFLVKIFYCNWIFFCTTIFFLMKSINLKIYQSIIQIFSCLFCSDIKYLFCFLNFILDRFQMHIFLSICKFISKKNTVKGHRKKPNEFRHEDAKHTKQPNEKVESLFEKEQQTHVASV